MRNISLDAVCEELDLGALLAETEELDKFRRESTNLYERVRASFFLYASHRFHLPRKSGAGLKGNIPFRGYEDLLQRRFPEAIAEFLKTQAEEGANDSISSALAQAYYGLGFQTLADQVRKSVRSVRGNQWMFRTGHIVDHPLRIRPELLRRESADAPFPILRELTAVRMDLTHSAWSDIFFLGMDFPEGARVLNVSIDLAVRGRDAQPKPPVEGYLRVIDVPVLRLASVDLGVTVDLTELSDVFDFAKDYLGLLKAAVIAAGIERCAVPDFAGTDRGADGPDAQRVERYFFPGDGFSGRGAGAERVDRPGGAWARCAAEAAGGGLPAGDR